MGNLIIVEPRLASKLKEPLTNIISTTPAKSLLYECINTATRCNTFEKKQIFLNLGFLGALFPMCKILFISDNQNCPTQINE